MVTGLDLSSVSTMSILAVVMGSPESIICITFLYSTVQNEWFQDSLIYQDVFFKSCVFSTSLHFVKISTGAMGLFKQQVVHSPLPDSNLSHSS